jgi:hypothetical protein
MEGARIAWAGQEGVAPEYKRENLQQMLPVIFTEREKTVVVARDREHRGKVDLEELLGDGARALIIEPPPGTIGEDAPSQFAGGEIVHTAQIAEHLR